MSKNITLSDLEPLKFEFKLKPHNIKGEAKLFEEWGFILDKDGKEIYRENSDGFWKKTTYKKNSKEIYCKWPNGYCEKTKYNESGKMVYYEDSDGHWWKVDGNKKIEFTNGEYYVNGKKHKLIKKICN